MGPDVIVPVMFFLIVVGAPIAAWITSRVLAHQERMEMIRHGFAPPPMPPDPHMMRRAMRHGPWTPGAPMPGPYAPYDPGFYAQHQLRRGIQVAFIGLALLIGLSFIGYHGNGLFYPGPWLLGGLVPLFVGVAQIITAVLGGARFPGLGSSASSAAFDPSAARQAPPPPGPSSGPVPPPPGSYGGWRPGPAPEIEKPASPPDYRA